MDIDRDRIRVIRQVPPAEVDPHEARAWGCFVVGFTGGLLVGVTAVLVVLRVLR